MLDEEEEKDYEMDDDVDGYEPDNVYVKPAFITKDEIEKMKVLGQFKELEEYDVIVSDAEKEKIIAEKQAKAEAEWKANPNNKVQDIGTIGKALSLKKVG